VDFIKRIGPEKGQNQRRGIIVDDFLQVKGVQDVWALGDATATKWAPTAQVASGQGRYLADFFNTLSAGINDSKEAVEDLKQRHGTFSYDHLGTLAYIGGDQAIADLPGNVHVGGMLTYYFWRSAYLSNLCANRNRVLVGFDWIKKTVFGRDISRE
jgi:NADH:ubiquinone reductase (non-electrogenic)